MNSTETTLSQRFLLAAGSAGGWALIWSLGSLLRYRVEGWEHFDRLNRRGAPFIFSFWHNQIFCATHFWRFRRICVITSQHADGEYMARIIRRFGYIPARGSSRRGSTGALLHLKRHLATGRPVGFAADGPVGPAYRVKTGPLWLAMKSGAPILPFHIQPRRYWAGTGWDGFRVPKPYSRALVKIGEPLAVPPGESVGDWVAPYQERMDALTEYCESYPWNRKRTTAG
jgi:hypothetical protein